MRSFEEIPDIAERIKRSKMELQESGFYWAPEWDSQSCCDQDYVNNFKKGWESRQTEVDELQNQLDVQTKHIEMALVAVKDIHKSAVDEFRKWDVLTEKTPKLCEHLQNLSVAVGELEQALKGEKQ